MAEKQFFSERLKQLGNDILQDRAEERKVTNWMWRVLFENINQSQNTGTAGIEFYGDRVQKTRIFCGSAGCFCKNSFKSTSRRSISRLLK